MNEQTKHVEKFKNEFALQFGYYPTVTLEDKKRVDVIKGDIQSLSNLIELYVNKTFRNIKDTSRKRELIILRNIFCMLAADMGYKYQTIADFLGKKCHATVIYSVNTGYDLLETDAEFQKLYIEISTLVDPNIYPHARINEVTDKESDNSQSANASRMHSRRYYVTRPCSRQRNKFRTIKTETVS